MSTPDKTSETLNLAAAMNANPSTSGSNDSSVVGVSKAKSKDDDMNANLSDMTKRLNDIDLSFRQKVITQESSSDFIVHTESHAPSTVNDPETEVGLINDVDVVDNGEIKLLDQVNNDDHATGLVMIQPEDDKDWKPDVGSVYNQVLLIQKTEPKKYAPQAFAKKDEPEVENIQVLPEVINCPKCNRKVAAGAINYHIKFCNPDHTQ